MPLFPDVCEISFKYHPCLSRDSLVPIRVPRAARSGQRDGELCAGEELGNGCCI